MVIHFPKGREPYLLARHRLAGNPVLQSLPFQQLHDNELLGFVFINVVDGADVGVIEGYVSGWKSSPKAGGAALAERAIWPWV